MGSAANLEGPKRRQLLLKYMQESSSDERQREFKALGLQGLLGYLGLLITMSRGAEAECGANSNGMKVFL